jgi:hypothetical protein
MAALATSSSHADVTAVAVATTAGQSRIRVALLTLSSHKNGSWMRDLARSLEAKSAGIIVSIVDVESLGPLSFTIDTPPPFDLVCVV